MAGATVEDGDANSRGAVTSDEEMRERGINSDSEPHRDPEILRYLLHERLLSLSEAASEIEETFGYNCSKSMISRAKDRHDIRDPVTDGPFADILEGGSETEPAQPPSFFLDRSEDSPTHPFDTDAHASNSSGEGGWWSERNAEPSTTPRSVSPSESDSAALWPELAGSGSEGGTGVFKGRVDSAPSEWRVSRSDREASLVAPPWAVYSEDFPDAYKACGCGGCERRHFLDYDGEEGDEGGPIDCPSPVPVTVAGARRIYQTTEGTRWAGDMEGSAVQRALQKYARLMKADSAVLRTDGEVPDEYLRGKTSYGDVTTVLLSLRASPTDDEERLVTPYALVQDAKDAWAEARDKLPTEDAFAYYWTFSGTDEWASIHLHCYLWFGDPEDDVSRDMFRPVVGRFCEVSGFAPWAAHFDGDDETEPLKEGTVRVEHDPLLVDSERLRSRSSGGVFADVLGDDGGAPDRLTEGEDVQSRGAVYVGSQLPHLALLGAESDADAEIAAFCRVADDGRKVSFGDGNFYAYAEALDALSEFEEPPM